jgi:hypothetical protein
MSTKVGGGGVLTKTKRVFLASGNTAYTGYAVCYNHDAVAQTVEAYAMTVLTAITDWCDARRVQVEAPSQNNNVNFAGVVDRQSNGVVGPNWILIHEPGSICNVATSAVISIGTTSQNETAYLNFTVGMNSAASYTSLNGKFTYAGFAGAGAAQILEENAANGLAMAQLLEGPQSGGVQAIGTVVTITAIANVSDCPLIRHGVVTLTACNLDTTDADLFTCGLSVPTHNYPGQRLLIKTAASTTASTATISAYGLYQCHAAGGTSIEVKYVALATIDAQTGFVLDMRHNGAFWCLDSYSVGSALLT